MSVTVRRFLPGRVGPKKKRRNDVSCGKFGIDATPKHTKNNRASESLRKVRKNT